MSDLQCPVRVLVVSRDQAVGFVARLADERIAVVVTSHDPAAVQVGQQVAAVCSAQVVARAEWPESLPAEGPEHAEQCRSAVLSARTVLDDLADSYRGEAVVVISEPGVLQAVAQWAGQAGTHATSPSGVALEGDADGWRSTDLFR